MMRFRAGFIVLLAGIIFMLDLVILNLSVFGVLIYFVFKHEFFSPRLLSISLMTYPIWILIVYLCGKILYKNRLLENLLGANVLTKFCVPFWVFKSISEK